MSSEPAKPLADPFIAALTTAENDDEPYTDEQRAAAQAGREAFQRGAFSSWEEVWWETAWEDEPESSHGEDCEDCEDCEGYGP